MQDYLKSCNYWNETFGAKFNKIIRKKSHQTFWLISKSEAQIPIGSKSHPVNRMWDQSAGPQTADNLFFSAPPCIRKFFGGRKQRMRSNA